MSERNAILVPGSSEELPCEIWRAEAVDLPFTRALLEASGIDLSAPSIDQAIASARPAILGPGALEYLDAEERAAYDYERAVLESPAYSGAEQHR